MRTWLRVAAVLLLSLSRVDIVFIPTLRRHHIVSSTPVLRSFVNGTFGAPVTTDWMEHRNPSDSTDVVARVPDSSPEDVDAAVTAAADAQQKWRALPGPARAEHLHQWAAAIGARSNDLATATSRE